MASETRTLSATVFRRADADEFGEDPREVMPVRKTERVGDVIYGVIAQHQGFPRQSDPLLTDVLRRGDARVCTEIIGEFPEAHSGSDCEPFVRKIACGLGADERAHPCKRTMRWALEHRIDVAESDVQYGRRRMVKLLIPQCGRGRNGEPPGILQERLHCRIHGKSQRCVQFLRTVRRDGKMDPEMRRGTRAVAVKDRIFRNQHRTHRCEGDAPGSPCDEIARRRIVVEAPERAVHSRMIPAGESLAKTAVVDKKPRGTVARDCREIVPLRGDKIQVAAMGDGHGEAGFDTSRLTPAAECGHYKKTGTISLSHRKQCRIRHKFFRIQHSYFNAAQHPCSTQLNPA